ncbi:uncharacterized protein LACBIDRAFT_325931 [Laccaria bicolor S238N-H82]|uniref:Predicted protein n=1 Tax=Laccaria bicolor (strain S238N-H82 / ATCC MYA-4686) TaxID=486041 RepID=B0D6Q5_LACBS|nr:uncharacterized protein LACBIDRAFT_325931 [Laccaria bicolor S238N-H82]EDR09264.1 predicted protein [Laccaria bicolor S238N-H82]|eukprot:XP_001879613.1 predicted protein [Laccaria bicolor S238N-H82]
MLQNALDFKTSAKSQRLNFKRQYVPTYPTTGDERLCIVMWQCWIIAFQLLMSWDGKEDPKNLVIPTLALTTLPVPILDSTFPFQVIGDIDNLLARFSGHRGEVTVSIWPRPSRRLEQKRNSEPGHYLPF